mgnify:FL=1
MASPNLPFLTADEVCAILGYTKKYLYKLTHQKQIPHYKPRGGKLLFDRAELEAWIRQNRVSTQQELENRAEALLNRGRV